MRIIIEIDDKEKGGPEIVSTASAASGQRGVDICTARPIEEETRVMEDLSAGPATPVTDSDENLMASAEPFPQEGGTAGAAPDLDVPAGETSSVAPGISTDAESAGTAPEFTE